jgi:hypothetical protein
MATVDTKYAPLWIKKEDKESEQLRVLIKITCILLAHSRLRFDELKHYPIVQGASIFADANGLGTNFKLKPDEASRIGDLWKVAGGK